MENRKNSSGAGLFLMEMIMAVFFFILCASTCIMVFVKADGMSRTARDINRSVVEAESIAEVWKLRGAEGLQAQFGAQPAAQSGTETGLQMKAQSGTETGLQIEAQSGTKSDLQHGENRAEIFWDGDWQAGAAPETAAYCCQISWETRDGLSQAALSITRMDDDTLLFDMTVAGYEPEQENAGGRP